MIQNKQVIYLIFGCIIAMVFSVSCDDGKSRPSEPPEEDLCTFDGAIIVDMYTKNDHWYYIECLTRNNKAEKVEVNSTLYRHIVRNYDEEDTIRCDMFIPKKVEDNQNIIPLLR